LTGTQLLNFLNSITSNVSTGSANRTLTINGTTTTVQATRYFRVVIDGVQSNVGTLVISPATPTKTVTVGTANGTMTAGVNNSSVSFPVTTTGFADGFYTGTLNNLPANVSGYLTSAFAIVDNAGLLVLRGNTSTVPGTHNNITLTVDGITSAPFTLVIVAPTVPPTSIVWYSAASFFNNTEPIEIRAGLSADFAIQVKPDDATDKRVKWTSSHPAMVSFGEGESGWVGSNYTMNHIDISETATPGTVVTVTVSSVANPSVQYTRNFTITAPEAKSITVGSVASGYLMLAGRTSSQAGGSVLYSGTTTNGISRGTHPVTLINAPAGVSVRYGTVQVGSNGSFSLFLDGNGTQTAGVHSNLQISFAGTTSNTFRLEIYP
jgi:hypothetical protein